MKKIGKRLLIFDLDGTLIDSKYDLASSLNHTLSTFDLPLMRMEDIYLSVGNGVSNLIKEALGRDRGDEYYEAVKLFLDHYEAHLLDTTVPYPGVSEALDRGAKFYRLAILTNKPYYLTEKIMAGLGMEDLFDPIVGGDTFDTKKPDPMGALSILTATGTDRGEAMIIGDSTNDVLTGKNSGIEVTGVSYGLGASDFNSHPPDYMVNTFPELFHILHPV